MSGCDVVGLLMANGRSSRMGTDKRLLPWRSVTVQSPVETTAPTDRTVLAAAFDAIAPSCDEMFVAAEPTAAIRSALGDRAYRFVAGDPGSDLGSSIAVALRGLLALRREAAPGALVLHLADHPAVRPETVSALIKAWRSMRDAIVSPEIPTAVARQSMEALRATSGHPIVVPGGLLHKILSHLTTTPPPIDGLRGFMRDPSTPRMRVAVDDLGIVVDLNSPDDYISAIEPTMPSGVPNACDHQPNTDHA